MCPPGTAACFRWQVATILLLTATSISDHTANRLEGHAGLFQLFFLVPGHSLTSYFGFGLVPAGVSVRTGCTVGWTSPVSCSLRQLDWPSCPPFPYVLWDVLIPFCPNYYFYSPSPKSLLLNSLTLTTYSYQASCFITLRSFQLNHSEPCAPSQAVPFHLLSVPFFCFSHQVLVLCLICGLHCIGFCLLFSFLHFNSICQSVSPLCSPHHPLSCLSPGQVTHPSVTSIYSFPPELPLSLPVNMQFINQTNKQFSALLFSHRNVKKKKKKRRKVSKIVIV